MKLLISFLLLAFLLSSCAPAATVTSTSTPTQTITPAPTATQTPKPTPTTIPTPTQIGGGSGKLIFEYYRVAFEKSFPDLQGEVHVFTSNWDGTNLIPTTNGLEGFNYIESISADGQMALVSSHPNNNAKGDLYLINLDKPGSNPLKLASGLEATNSRKAIFLDKARIVYIGQGVKGYGIYIVNFDGIDSMKIGAPTGKYPSIVSSDKTRVYYESSVKENFQDSSGVLYGYGDFSSLWWINIDGSGQGKLESNGHQIFPASFAFSPDSTSITWIPNDMESGCSLLWGSALSTPLIRDGSYTKYLERPSMFINQKSPHLRKVIDIPYVEDYVRQCFLMHVASLSNLDNDTKIPLIPPFDPAKDDFYYHTGYILKWWPDSSKILLYDSGSAMIFWWDGMTDYYPLTLYELSPKDTNPNLVQLKVLSKSLIVQPEPGKLPHLTDSFDLFEFSPDGRQIMLGKYDQGPYVNILNLGTLDFTNDFGRAITPDSQTQRIGSIYWLP